MEVSHGTIVTPPVENGSAERALVETSPSTSRNATPNGDNLPVPLIGRASNTVDRQMASNDTDGFTTSGTQFMSHSSTTADAAGGRGRTSTDFAGNTGRISAVEDEQIAVQFTSDEHERRRCLEVEGGKLQKIGWRLYLFVLLFVLAINLPFMILQVTLYEPYQAESFWVCAIPAYFINTGVVAAISICCYCFRKTPAIRGRGINYLSNLFVSAFVVVFSTLMHIGCKTGVIFPFADATAVPPVPSDTALFVEFIIMTVSALWFLGAVAGRAHVLNLIFGSEMCVYTPRQLNFHFYLPCIILMGVAALGIIFYGLDLFLNTSSYVFGILCGVIFFIIPLLAAVFILYFTLKMRKVDKFFCDWEQLMRSIVFAFLLSTCWDIYTLVYRISHDAGSMPPTATTVLSYLTQILIMHFLVDSFAATCLRLMHIRFLMWRINKNGGKASKDGKSLSATKAWLAQPAGGSAHKSHSSSNTNTNTTNSTRSPVTVLSASTTTTHATTMVTARQRLSTAPVQEESQEED